MLLFYGKDKKNVYNKAYWKEDDAGGCDATDDYGQGYDDAITLALNILLEETGYTIEEILDYEEDDGTYETGKEKAAERKTGEGSWNKKEVAVSVFVKLTAAKP